MSADAWRVCPSCEHGRVFNAQEDTLREDYEVGMAESGEFHVHYRASCTKCGFEFRYDYAKQAWSPSESQ